MSTPTCHIWYPRAQVIDSISFTLLLRLCGAMCEAGIPTRAPCLLRLVRGRDSNTRPLPLAPCARPRFQHARLASCALVLPWMKAVLCQAVPARILLLQVLANSTHVVDKSQVMGNQ